MTAPVNISVLVPVYNVEPYLAPVPGKHLLSDAS